MGYSLDSVEFMTGDAPIRFSVLVRCCGYYIWRQRGPRRLLVPANLFEIIADILFIKGWLGFSGNILVAGPESRRIRSKRFVNPDEIFADESEFEFCVSDDDAAFQGVLCGA